MWWCLERSYCSINPRGAAESQPRRTLSRRHQGDKWNNIAYLKSLLSFSNNHLQITQRIQKTVTVLHFFWSTRKKKPPLLTDWAFILITIRGRCVCLHQRVVWEVYVPPRFPFKSPSWLWWYIWQRQGNWHYRKMMEEGFTGPCLPFSLGVKSC